MSYTKLTHAAVHSSSFTLMSFIIRTVLGARCSGFRCPSTSRLASYIIVSRVYLDDDDHHSNHYIMRNGGTVTFVLESAPGIFSVYLKVSFWIVLFWIVLFFL